MEKNGKRGKRKNARKNGVEKWGQTRFKMEKWNGKMGSKKRGGENGIGENGKMGSENGVTENGVRHDL